MQFNELIETKEIIVCCGSGGVGKTTTAAAVAIHAALQGLKVLVLTIDPAKRLANSLGLSELGNEQRRVPAKKFTEVGLNPKGELYAMMLDTKRTFDDLIIKYAVNEEMSDKILNNDLYKNISGAFAGSQEYMAMEKLFEMHSQGEYDLIVLDTPPTKHALDFLDAPNRMTTFLDGRILKWFLRPYFSAGKKGFRVFQKGTGIILKTLEKITGMAALKVASEFFISFEGMYDGFKERAAAVYDLLRDDITGFILVTSPDDITIDEAIFFHDKLVEYEMPFFGLIVNRVHTDFATDAGVERLIERGDPDDLAIKIGNALGRKADEKKTMSALMTGMTRNFEAFRSLALADSENIGRLSEHIDEDAPVKIVPFFDTDIYDIDGLLRVNQYVFDNGKK
jgi:anion-transporting  ArsA/GET3 family ATPase